LKKLSVQDIEVQGRRVLMRVDFNVPLDQGAHITDDTRIRSAVSTIEYLVSRGARPVIMSHLGRPKGETRPELSLRAVARRLGDLLSSRVHFADDCVGAAARSVVERSAAGEAVLLENLRFHEAETNNDSDFSAQLAELGDVYVNDAFGTAHRSHASTVGVTRHFDERASGLLMDKELENLGGLLRTPGRPFLAILGGAKVSGKIEVIENLIGKVNAVLIGGGMAFTFFRALGLDVGKSLVEESLLDTVQEILEQAKASSTQLILPEDIVVADRFDEAAARDEVLVTDIPDGWMGLDIGSRTCRRFAEHLESASTVFWNGPMGVFEMEPFAKGTRSVARSVARSTDHGCRTVVGGGDSVAAITALDLQNRITHVSTGGGASLEFLAGKSLPGVDALSDAKSAAV
jgi:phosphoglycerate kinase